jgi:hypothetical protein
LVAILPFISRDLIAIPILFTKSQTESFSDNSYISSHHREKLDFRNLFSSIFISFKKDSVTLFQGANLSSFLNSPLTIFNVYL